MRTKICRCSFIAIVAAFALPFLLHAQSLEQFRKWNQPIEPFRVIGNVHYVGTNEIGSYLITTSEGHILIDGGFEESVPIISRNIDALGYELTDVAVLLNSHAHVDHAGGLAALKELTGAKLMIMAGDVAAIESGGKSENDPYPFPPVEVDSVLQDQARIQVGETVLTAHLTPGHTRGCTTWSMTAKDGDRDYQVVFVSSPNVLPNVKLVDNEIYPEVAEDFRKTFAIMRELECEVFLGAHGSFFRLGSKIKRRAEGEQPNPFIDPDGYRRFVDHKEEVFLERLAAELGEE